MWKTGYAITLIFGATKSGRFFRNHEGLGPEYIPLIRPPLSDDEWEEMTPPWSAIQLITQGIPWLNHLSTPPPLHTPSPTPRPPSPPFNMENLVKWLVFMGLGIEDPDKFWFVAKALSKAHGIINDQMKKATLVTTLHEHALTCYIKYCTDNPMSMLRDIQTTWIRNSVDLSLKRKQLWDSKTSWWSLVRNPGIWIRDWNVWSTRWTWILLMDNTTNGLWPFSCLI